MEGFVKIYAEMIDSSVWGESHATRVVWITMLAMASPSGIVSASVGGLARRAVVTRAECVEALEVFLGPDPDSRDGTTGERIEPVDGGWLILNHQRYRERRSQKQIGTAKRVAKHRASKAVTCNDVTPGNAQKTEAELKADPESSLRSDPARTCSGPDLLSDFERVERAIVAKRRELGKAWRRGMKDYDAVTTAAEAVRDQAGLEGIDFDDLLSECLDAWADDGWVIRKGYPVGSFLIDPLKQRGTVDAPEATDADARAERKDALRITAEAVDAARRAVSSGPDPSADPEGHADLSSRLKAAEAAHGENVRRWR